MLLRVTSFTVDPDHGVLFLHHDPDNTAQFSLHADTNKTQMRRSQVLIQSLYFVLAFS